MSQIVFDVAIRLAIVLALVFANGFFVAAEFALVTVRKTRVDQLIAEGVRSAVVVRRATLEPDSYIAATQLGITMASLGLGWIGEPVVADLFRSALNAVGIIGRLSDATAHTLSFAIAFTLITALHIVLGELAPKTVALQYPEKTSLLVARPTEVFMTAFWPFIRLLNGMGRSVVNCFGLKAPSGHSLVHSEEELKMLVTASQEAGVLEETEEQMLHRVFAFADLSAAQIMVPRTEMAAVPLTSSLQDLVDLLATDWHTHLPVYREDLDDVVGIVHMKDIMKALASPGEPFLLSGIVREVLTVPETMTADHLLGEMRQLRVRQAIVIDEHGGTAGLATFEGLMERIVGEVGTEFEPAHPRIAPLHDGGAMLDGLALVTDVNERFELGIDDTTYNTIGGYVLGRLGRRPKVGDTIELDGRTLSVEALDGLRVSRVRLSRAPEQIEEDKRLFGVE